jgi:hypothetical protein
MMMPRTVTISNPIMVGMDLDAFEESIVFCFPVDGSCFLVSVIVFFLALIVGQLKWLN